MVGGIVAVTLVALYMAKSAAKSLASVPGQVSNTVKGAYEYTKDQGGVAPIIGDVLGVPRTDLTACQQAMAAGKTFEASLYCPAADFLRYLSGASAPAPATAGASEWGSFDTGSGGNTW